MGRLSRTHFETMVEELLKDRGPLKSREIAYALAEDERLMVISSPSEVEHNDDGEEVVIKTEDDGIRAVSTLSIQKRLERAWFLYQDSSGRWHLGSP